jgi:hypothetical protein
MKKLLIASTLLSLSVIPAFAQKGVDEQNRKIQENTNKTTENPANRETRTGGKTIEWGGRARASERLDNPYRLTSRRDVLVESVIDVLQERKIIVDEASSRLRDGLIVTQPFIFARGAVIAKNELSRYAILPTNDGSWTRGRYTLTIDIQSIDGVQNNVTVTAKVEGRSEVGMQSEWTTLQSSGHAENEFLKKLVEAVTGVAFDDLKPSGN